MAYSDYGAFVYKNEKRIEGLEDAAGFSFRTCHGIIDDTQHIIVECYKYGLPKIWYDGKEIKYYDNEKINQYDFKPFYYKINGYIFDFEVKNNIYSVLVATPEGDSWLCKYGYHFGSGFEFENNNEEEKYRLTKGAIVGLWLKDWGIKHNYTIKMLEHMFDDLMDILEKQNYIEKVEE